MSRIKNLEGGRFTQGQSDFVSLRSDGGLYVDKSGWISDLLRAGGHVDLIARPRRFGKSLNLRTIAAWFDRQVTPGRGEALFGDLSIWSDPEARAVRGRHPVILVSLASAGGRSWEAAESSLRSAVSRCFEPHRDILTERGLEEKLRSSADTNEAVYALTEALHRRHGEKVVVLVDEYDSLLVRAREGDGEYVDEARTVLRQMFGAALKDNPHLHRAVLTGVTEFSAFSIHSGLNHLISDSVFEGRFGEWFGLTEEEVEELLEGMVPADLRGDVRTTLSEWFDGYRIGGRRIFNPWSVLRFLQDLRSSPRSPRARAPMPYWMNTGNPAEVETQLMRRGAGLSSELGALLRGETVEVQAAGRYALRDLASSPAAFWTLLTSTGYLTLAEPSASADPDLCTLRVPNREVLAELQRIVNATLESSLGGAAEVVRFYRLLRDGDETGVRTTLQEFCQVVLSSHDLHPGEPERTYHVFLLGLLAHIQLAGGQLRSNRESGHGRFDITIEPSAPGDRAVLLEIKRARSQAGLEGALREAVEQVRHRRYTADLSARGHQEVIRWALAFSGKHVAVALVPEPPPTTG